MEVVTEGQTTSEHTNNYEISEQFSCFDGDLNVINDKGDDNDTYQNEGDDSDVIDDVTDAINGTKKSRITTQNGKSCSGNYRRHCSY